jgi:hypothetical protein
MMPSAQRANSGARTTRAPSIETFNRGWGTFWRQRHRDEDGRARCAMEVMPSSVADWLASGFTAEPRYSWLETLTAIMNRLTA